MSMQVAKNTVVTLDYSVTDPDGELVDAGQEPIVYLHGGYDDIFPMIEEAVHGKKIGESVTIKRLHGEGALKRRIMDMGLTKGTEVYVRKVAPLGDPMELTVRGYELSVRKSDAENIEVE